MKALILVGGFGTRLRPLTFSYPKSVVEFINKPMVEHQIAALAKVGVTEIILAINYQADVIQKYMDYFSNKYKIKVTSSQETEPLGTAGPIRLAKEKIMKDNDSQLFFVFNSDITCTFPLQKLIDFHKTHGKEGTIMLTEVKDPSRFGVVVYNEQTGQIKDFIEKPQEFISNKINAGIYLFNTKMIDRIPERPTSIERETFPQMSKDGQLYSFILEDFWMDIGQPKDFLLGSFIYMNHMRTVNDPDLEKNSSNIIGNVVIDKTAKISNSAVIGPNVIIGPNCTVGNGVRIKESVILKNTLIDDHSYINKSLIGWNNKIGKWCRIDNESIFGENISIKSEVYINGIIILPHKQINDNETQKGTILM